MTKSRLVAVVIVRDGQVVQSEKFKHNHVIHYDAVHAVESFSRWDVDEIVILNVSPSSSSRHDFASIVEHVSNVCWVPLSAGGYIDDIDYGTDLIRRGADKLVINSSFYSKPEVPLGLSNKFGRQCIIASMDIREKQDNEDAVWVKHGSYCTEFGLLDWIARCESNGAGELLINNIDYDGNRGGYDLQSLRRALKVTDLPIIIFGGAFLNKHFAQGLDAGASAVAAANIFHYKEMATKQVKRYLTNNGYNVRKV